MGIDKLNAPLQETHREREKGPAEGGVNREKRSV
jgi:hypothetical protein